MMRRATRRRLETAKATCCGATNQVIQPSSRRKEFVPDWKCTMLRRLLILMTVVLGAPALGYTQVYSTGITADYELIPNVTYLETGAWQGKLDLWVRADTREPIATVIFFHGGADDRGTKETEVFRFVRYLELGWNVVNVEHRLPGVTLAPTFMQNALCAVRWVGRNANLYGLDLSKLVISGASAGGWAALTTAMA